jgi:hypothetical protein
MVSITQAVLAPLSYSPGVPVFPDTPPTHEESPQTPAEWPAVQGTFGPEISFPVISMGNGNI